MTNPRKSTEAALRENLDARRERLLEDAADKTESAFESAVAEEAQLREAKSDWDAMWDRLEDSPYAITAARVVLGDILAQRRDVYDAIVNGCTAEDRAVLEDILARRKVVYDAIDNSG